MCGVVFSCVYRSLPLRFFQVKSFPNKRLPDVQMTTARDNVLMSYSLFTWSREQQSKECWGVPWVGSETHYFCFPLFLTIKQGRFSASRLRCLGEAGMPSPASGTNTTTWRHSPFQLHGLKLCWSRFHTKTDARVDVNTLHRVFGSTPSKNSISRSSILHVWCESSHGSLFTPKDATCKMLRFACRNAGNRFSTQQAAFDVLWPVWKCP